MRWRRCLCLIAVLGVCAWMRYTVSVQGGKIDALREELDRVQEIIPGMIRAELQAHEERMMVFLRRR